MSRGEEDEFRISYPGSRIAGGCGEAGRGIMICDLGFTIWD